MTRGTFIYVKDEECYQSTEFNGGMYIDGSGQEAIIALSHVTDKDSFIEEVLAFNENHHGYPIDEVKKLYPTDVMFFKDMKREDYFKVWFSDYLFSINLGEPIKICDIKNKRATIGHNEIAVFNFGELIATLRIVENNRLKLILTTEDFEYELKEADKLLSILLI